MKKKSFISVGDRKLLDRQRLIALHYAEISMNLDRLESESLARLQDKENYEF
jgi:hypothetical protein